MKVAVLFSGGKDSTFALYKAIEMGFDVKYLISIFSKNKESYMFHYPNIKSTKIQAQAMGLPLIIKVTEGLKEHELTDLKDVLSGLKNIHAIVSGALASEYQKSRIEKIAKNLGLKSFTPLWHKDPFLLWKEILEKNFKVIITSVACEGLDGSWLGKEVNSTRLEKLKKLSEKYKFNLGFEGGEAETFVVDCPLFKKKIKIIQAESKFDDKLNTGIYIFKKIKFIKKSI